MSEPVQVLFRLLRGAQAPGPAVRVARLLLLGALLPGALSAAAAQTDALVVHARVVEVVPVTRSERVAEAVGDCAPAHPGAGAGLDRLLAWDLRSECRTRVTTREIVEAYRVRYRWNDHEFTQLMDSPPGDRVPVRLVVH
ncbi:MAG: hypothetical protein V2I63_05675 [Pseudomonadales bacterium]|jgi:hypothetical protein|nr:hypothetical protein [Pseudomonadales bacterium]